MLRKVSGGLDDETMGKIRGGGGPGPGDVRGVRRSAAGLYAAHGGPGLRPGHALEDGGQAGGLGLRPEGLDGVHPGGGGGQGIDPGRTGQL